MLENSIHGYMGMHTNPNNQKSKQSIMYYLDSNSLSKKKLLGLKFDSQKENFDIETQLGKIINVHIKIPELF